MNQNNAQRGEIGIAGVLTLIFLTLKLTRLITWSWWWVFSPYLVLIPLFIIVMLIILLISTVQAML